MSYHEVPADVLEDPVLLSEWLNKAVGEAALATATKPKPKSSRSPKPEARSLTPDA